MNENEVDKWVEETGSYDAEDLLDEKLPKMRAKLNRLDKRIRDVLSEVQEVFPDACYYTGSGGFSLVLGSTHADGLGAAEQSQRLAWGGLATIDDGDW